MNELNTVELVVKVLMELVARDERQQASMKLGDKLVKWSTSEVDKAISAPKT